MNLREFRKFKELIGSLTDEEIKEFDKAVDGIPCEICGTEKGVLYYGSYSVTIFMCFDCIKRKYEEPEPEPKSSKGLTLRFKVLMRDNFRCVYCGRNPKEDGVKLEVDHVFPKSKGGLDAMENLVTACWECNQGKKDIVIKREK